MLSISVSCFTASAQAPPVQWDVLHGGSAADYVQGIVQLDDGGYMLVGQTICFGGNSGDVTGGSGYSDVWLVRLDPSGALLWQNAIGGTDAEDGKAIARTADGGFILTGVTGSNDVDVSGQHGSDDVWVVKLDANGTIQWQRCLGGSSLEEGWAVQQTADLGYIIAGWAHSTNGDVTGLHVGIGTGDAWLVKLDSSGNTQWTHCYGGTAQERAHAVVQTSDGGYAFCAYAYSTDGDVTGHHGQGDFWVAKVDANGTLVWQTALGGTSTEWPMAMALGPNGGVVVAGHTGSTDGDLANSHIPGMVQNAWVVQLDAAGAPVWQHCYVADSTATGVNARLHTISASSDGGYLCGGASENLWVFKIDGNGVMQWQYVPPLGGGIAQDGARAVQATADGGVVVAGEAATTLNGQLGNGWTEYYTLKLGQNVVGAIAPTTASSAFAHYDPAARLLTLNGPVGCEGATLAINDATGREVLRTAWRTGGQVIDLGREPAGLYVLNVRGDGCAHTQQFVVQ